MRFLLLAISSAIAGPGDPPPATFQIDCAGQTSHSVHLVWETDREVRTLKTARDWSPSTPTGPTHTARIVPGEGRRGTTAAKIAGKTSTGDARACFIQDMDDVRQPGTYSYSLFYRTAEQDQGSARLVIDCYLGDQREYHGLVHNDLPPSQEWNEVKGTLELPDDVRLTRILLYRAGAGTAWFDDARISKAGSPDNVIANGGFEGTHSWRVFFRKQGDQQWQAVDAVVLERFHNVISLQPDTDYEFMVRRVAADGTSEAESQVLSARTGTPQDRVWQGLRFGPDRRTPTPPSVYPCVESLGGKLYFCDSRGGILWLSELDDQLQARWTKQWVAPYPVDGRPCYQGQSQTAVLGSKLYVSWKRAYHGDAPHARQCVASYDTQTGRVALASRQCRGSVVD